jgi:TerC family integral membrane protein
VDVAPWIWVAFATGIAAVLLVDVAVFHRRAANVTVAQAAAWTIVWLLLAVAFAGVVWLWRGDADATAYLAGFLIERSLSIDNVFVFALIMAGFGVSERHQARVLLWGVLGALALRAVLIAVGVEMLERVEWTAYLLGALLIVTGVRMVLHRPDQVDPGANPVVRLIGRLLPVDPGDDSGRVLRLRGGRVVATPLLAVLVAVATTDLIFAIDSVPAILAITREPLLLVAANAFAMLGLRSLYFCVAGLVDRFVYLAPGLAIVLVFIGLKMVWGQAVGHVPISLSLPVIAAIIGAAIIASLVATRGRRVTPAADGG